MNFAKMPYGYMQCTCEQFPKVTHINDQMLSYLKLTLDSPEWNNFYKENIYFMLPFEERELFRQQLESSKKAAEPVCIRHHIVSANNQIAPYMVWIKYISTGCEFPYYSMIYTEETGDPETQPLLDNSYFHALESAYGVIFEINLSTSTVECIHGRKTSDIGNLYDARMTIESAKSFWLSNYVLETDREMMNDYFNRIATPGEIERLNRPLQATFSILWDDKITYQFLAVAVKKEDNIILLCLRDVTQVKYSSLQANETLAYAKLNHYVQKYIETQRNALGLLAFTLEENKLYPIFSSQLLYSKIPMTTAEYLHCIAEGIPLDEFCSMMPFSIHDFEKILEGHPFTFSGEGFLKNGEPKDKSFTLTCFKYPDDKDIFYELILRETSSESIPDIPANGIFARTFGHFDLFCNGEPVIFSNAKEKELFALLIDRKGGTLTSCEAVEILWPDKTPDENLKARYRKLAMTLKRTLEKYNISNILNSKNGTRNIVTSELTCDYYELLNNNETFINAFHNSYMPEYSWAEETLATLWDYS